jgi:citrate synthase
LRLAVMMPSLAAAEHRLPARSRIDQARMIITVLPLGLAPAAARGAGASGSAKGASAGMAASLCERSLGDYLEADREVLDRVLVACAEHELNASTFAARVVASTGADLYPSVLAGLCSLSGPIHGGACDRIESMFADLESAIRLDQALDAFGARHSLPPGFGHTIYPRGDPRAALLKRVARATAKRKGHKLFETALKVEEAVWKRQRLRPNLDFYLTVCVRMLGFPRGLPAAIFAMGRAAGWIAHSLEQSADNRLIRPRMRYHGSLLRHWG